MGHVVKHEIRMNQFSFVLLEVIEQYCSYLISTPSISNNTKYLKDCADWKKEDK